MKTFSVSSDECIIVAGVEEYVTRISLCDDVPRPSAKSPWNDLEHHNDTTEGVIIEWYEKTHHQFHSSIYDPQTKGFFVFNSAWNAKHTPVFFIPDDRFKGLQSIVHYVGYIVNAGGPHGLSRAMHSTNNKGKNVTYITAASTYNANLLLCAFDSEYFLRRDFSNTNEGWNCRHVGLS